MLLRGCAEMRAAVEPDADHADAAFSGRTLRIVHYRWSTILLSPANLAELRHADSAPQTIGKYNSA